MIAGGGPDGVPRQRLSLPGPAAGARGPSRPGRAARPRGMSGAWRPALADRAARSHGASLPRRASLPRPRKAFGPVGGTAVAVAAWLGVAHSSGAGWVQALGALLTGILMVGLAAPALAVGRARCAVVDSPGDGVAGRPSTVTVAVRSPVVVRFLDPPGPGVATGRARQLPVPLVPGHRGVLAGCRVELASAAPFGLLWWTRQVVVPLPRPLHVAPAVGDAGPEGAAADGSGDRATRPVDRVVGEPRGVRDYRPGDLRSWVHWPATAHAGTLMVREMEGPGAAPVTVQALLPDDPDVADELAARALGAVAGLLATGQPVVLVTAEPVGAVERPVSSVAEAGRRLARALPRRAASAVTVGQGSGRRFRGNARRHGAGGQHRPGGGRGPTETTSSAPAGPAEPR